MSFVWQSLPSQPLPASTHQNALLLLRRCLQKAPHDLDARHLAQLASEQGVKVIVENVPGATGSIGMTRVDDGDFDHPHVEDGSALKPHVLYAIGRPA